MSSTRGWRCRLFIGATALATYLIISAYISIHKIKLPPDRSNDEDRSSPQRNLASLPVIRPGGLPVVVPGQRYLSPRRIRSRSGPAIEWCHPLRYKKHAGPLVALASFPGSGNTWLRYLLQQATGILTGSVYKDYALLKNGFPGENVVNGSVIAVKTHEFGKESIGAFDKVVLLVRDPFSSLQAEFNRRSGGHIGHASLDKYKRNNGKYWTTFVHSKADEWERMNAAWFGAFRPEDRLVVSYDDLLSDTRSELTRALNFLLEGDEKTAALEAASLDCVMRRKQGIYKRPKRLMNFDAFDAEMKSFVNERWRRLYSRVLGLPVPVQQHEAAEEEEGGKSSPPRFLPQRPEAPATFSSAAASMTSS